jgi:hypothetical protein
LAVRLNLGLLTCSFSREKRLAVAQEVKLKFHTIVNRNTTSSHQLSKMGSNCNDDVGSSHGEYGTEFEHKSEKGLPETSPVIIEIVFRLGRDSHSSPLPPPSKYVPKKDGTHRI